jgi:hypothetical protein
MRRDRKDPPSEVRPAVGNRGDSQAILDLIEQLDRDLKESEGKASKAQ